MAACIADAAEAQPPNIVFIMVDDMGYADVGCYGSNTIQTPNLDRLAADGIRFTNAYSGCVVCAPARSTLMTGLHMGHTPVRGNTGGIPLPADTVTLPRMMQEAGYATGGFGKWGLGDLDTTGVPEQQGFDVFFGYYHQIHAHSYYPDYLIRNSTKVALPNNRRKRGDHYAHYRIFDEMLQFIRDNAKRPFFCYAPWTPPHDDYVIPRDDKGWRRYWKKPWPRNARVVAAMTAMIDRQVGEVLALLDELGIADNTVVFFCSDNGAAYRFDGTLNSSGALRGAKRTIYEGGLRVPLMVRWPGRIAPGSASDFPTYFPDVFPTVAELTGQAIPDGLDGVSIAPTLQGKSGQQIRDYLYWEYPLYDWNKRAYPEDGLMQAARNGDWKLMRHRTSQPWELYNLARDVGEANNVAAAHPEIVARMSAWMAANRVEPIPQTEPVPPEGKNYR